MSQRIVAADSFERCVVLCVVWQSNFLNGRASASDYPSPNDVVIRPTYKTLIVYIVGGCTYQESAFVETINKGSASRSHTYNQPTDDDVWQYVELTVVAVFPCSVHRVCASYWVAVPFTTPHRQPYTQTSSAVVCSPSLPVAYSLRSVACRCVRISFMADVLADEYRDNSLFDNEQAGATTADGRK